MTKDEWKALQIEKVKKERRRKKFVHWLLKKKAQQAKMDKAFANTISA